MAAMNSIMLFLALLCSEYLRCSIYGYMDSRTYEDIRPLELYNDAVNLQRQANFLGAIDVYEQALTMFPAFPEAHQNLAHLYDSQNKLDLALLHHRLSVQHASSEWFNASAIVNVVLMELKMMPTKTLPLLQPLSALLSEAEDISPNNTNVLFTHAQLHEHMGDLKMCVEYLRRVLAIDDRHILAWLNLGNQWFKANNFEVATKFYKNALERIPGEDVYNRVLVLNNLGQCYRERGMLALAHGSFAAALQALNGQDRAGRDGDNVSTAPAVPARVHNGTMDSSGGGFHGKGVHFWCLNNLYTIQGLSCDWRDFEHMEGTLEAFLAPAGVTDIHGQRQVYDLASFRAEGVQLDAYTMSLLRYASRAVDRRVCEESCPVQPVYTHSARQVEMGDTATGRKRALKVAYLSHDWRDHPMGRLTATLLTGHSRDDVALSAYSSAQLASARVDDVDQVRPNNLRMGGAGVERRRINATAVSYGSDDSSDVRKYVEAFAGAFIDIFSVRNDMEAAQIIRNEDFDILVDITAHTYNGRIEIAAVKSAPLLINYLGFPGTTGCPGFDYTMVTAAIVPPEIAAELFTERVLYLPHSYQSNDMPLRVALPICGLRDDSCRNTGLLVRRAAAERDVREEFPDTPASDVPSVPAGALLVCSFNANKKMEPVSFRAWMNILQRVTPAVLVLLDVAPDVKQHLVDQAHFAGVRADRLVFIPKRDWKRHLQRSAECDLVLDTFVYGAHTTASDVLWMGAPLLSLAAFGSQRMPSRVAASITQALDLPQTCAGGNDSTTFCTGRLLPQHLLVVDSITEYENTAVTLLRASAATRRVLASVITHKAVRGASFDSELMQKSIEFAYQAAHEMRMAMNALGSVHLPHIVIPDIFPQSELGSVADQCGATWEKKFRRDLGLCCGWDESALDSVFRAAWTSSEPIPGEAAVKELLGMCAASLATRDEERPTGDVSVDCRAPDLAAVTRRLVVAFPGLRFLHPAHTTAAEGSPASAVTISRSSAVDSSMRPEDLSIRTPTAGLKEPFDCGEYLTASCALSSLSDLRVDPPPTCAVQHFPAAFEFCYYQNAPATLDFVMNLQGQLLRANLHSQESALVNLLRSVAFIADKEISDIDPDAAATTLRKLTSVTNYVSALWRTISSDELRDAVVGALLPQQAMRAIPADEYWNTINAYSVKVFAPRSHRQYRVRLTQSVCSQLLAQNNIYLSVTREEPQCIYMLGRQLAAVLSDHSAAQPAQTRPGEQRQALFDMIAAFMLDPSDLRLMNLGVMLMDGGESEVGFFLANVAALRLAKATPLSAEVVARLPWASESTAGRDGSGESSGQKPTRIIFYCNEYGRSWWPGWGPSSLIRKPGEASARGMGGSEEAVYYSAIELARRGFEVVVYAGVTEVDHGTMQYFDAERWMDGPGSALPRGARAGGAARGSVTWLHYDSYDPTPEQPPTRCEVFFAWRYGISLGLARSPRTGRDAPGASDTGARCGGKYLWLHDLVPSNILPPSYFMHFDGILVQSDFHRDYVLDGFSQHQLAHNHVNMDIAAQAVHIVPNGLSLSDTSTMDGVNDRNIFLYASSPSRGLALVLSQWRTIKRHIPSATLEVYYGFTESVLKEMRGSLGDAFDAWYAQMQEYLRQDGVKYFGAVDHDALTQASAHAGFLLYPTTFQETGCITVLRAMACGAIPITSRLQPSVLQTLTNGHDLGPKEALTVDTARDPAAVSAWLDREWTPAVIAAHRRSDLDLRQRRARMKENVRSAYSWSATARMIGSLAMLKNAEIVHS